MTLEQLPVPGGATGRMERGFAQQGKGQGGNGSKLTEGRFRLDIGKKFFPRRVVKHWPRLPREAVAALSLAGFKTRLDGALSNVIWRKTSQPMAGGLEPDDL